MEKKVGFDKLLHDIRYRRHRFRQLLGVTLIIFMTLVGRPEYILYWIGTVLVIIGISIRLWASGHIKKDKELAVDGPYAYVRHPLYVGNIVAGFGFALAAGQWWWTVPLLIVFLLGFYPHAVQKEDKKLHRLFQKDWENWKEHTRALIPRTTPFGEGGAGEWSFWQSLRQNGEPIIAAFLFMCLYYLYVKL